ncbi:MAG: NADPH-dependent FMN reductase [Caulobacter sp.]|nr:NADPH-dependent FMN reductase [Vitreoscilla sp.]
MAIVALAGSPSANSRSTALLRHVLASFPESTPRGEIVLRDLPAAALVRADFDDPAIRRAREQVAAARLVVIATPIYKAAYSGLLKTFLDLLPQDALRGKTVLALGTGGSAAHLLALDYALKPVLAALGARHILDAAYAVDAQFTLHPQHGHVAHDDVLQRTERALADGPLPLRVASPLALVA